MFDSSTWRLKYISTAEPLTVAQVKFSMVFLSWNVTSKFKTMHNSPKKILPWRHWFRSAWFWVARAQGKRPSWQCTRRRWSWRIRPTPFPAPWRWNSSVFLPQYRCWEALPTQTKLRSTNWERPPRCHPCFPVWNVQTGRIWHRFFLHFKYYCKVSNIWKNPLGKECSHEKLKKHFFH